MKIFPIIFILCLVTITSARILKYIPDSEKINNRKLEASQEIEETEKNINLINDEIEKNETPLNPQNNTDQSKINLLLNPQKDNDDKNLEKKDLSLNPFEENGNIIEKKEDDINLEKKDLVSNPIQEDNINSEIVDSNKNIISNNLNEQNPKKDELKKDLKDIYNNDYLKEKNQEEKKPVPVLRTETIIETFQTDKEKDNKEDKAVRENIKFDKMGQENNTIKKTNTEKVFDLFEDKINLDAVKAEPEIIIKENPEKKKKSFNFS